MRTAGCCQDFGRLHIKWSSQRLPTTSVFAAVQQGRWIRATAVKQSSGRHGTGGLFGSASCCRSSPPTTPPWSEKSSFPKVPAPKALLKPAPTKLPTALWSNLPLEQELFFCLAVQGRGTIDARPLHSAVLVAGGSWEEIYFSCNPLHQASLEPHMGALFPHFLGTFSPWALNRLPV